MIEELLKKYGEDEMFNLGRTYDHKKYGYCWRASGRNSAKNKIVETLSPDITVCLTEFENELRK